MLAYDCGLPTDVAEKILCEIWVSSLSPEDRITLITSSLLVNKAWKALFTYISFRDVNIVCPSYYHQYMAALAGHSSLFDKDDKWLSNNLCRSITIKIPKADDDEQEAPMAKVLSDLLYSLSAIAYLPNLRTLNVEYENMGFDDLLDHYRLVWFPIQIISLNISFAFDSDKQSSANTLRATHQYHTSQSYPMAHHGVRYLSFSGASNAFITRLTACFPNVESPLILPSPKPIVGLAWQPSAIVPVAPPDDCVYPDTRKSAVELWASAACWSFHLASINTRVH